MSSINRFEDLEVWQMARELCDIIFEKCERHPFCNDFKLRDQFNGSSGSVMDNIAEGFERNGNKEFKQFLSIAKDSCGETRSQIYRAFDRKYITQEEFDLIFSKPISISGKIGKLIKHLQNNNLKGSKYKSPSKL